MTDLVIDTLEEIALGKLATEKILNKMGFEVVGTKFVNDEELFLVRKKK